MPVLTKEEIEALLAQAREEKRREEEAARLHPIPPSPEEFAAQQLAYQQRQAAEQAAAVEEAQLQKAAAAKQARMLAPAPAVIPAEPSPHPAPAPAIPPLPHPTPEQLAQYQAMQQRAMERQAADAEHVRTPVQEMARTAIADLKAALVDEHLARYAAAEQAQQRARERASLLQQQQAVADEQAERESGAFLGRAGGRMLLDAGAELLPWEREVDGRWKWQLPSFLSKEALWPELSPETEYLTSYRTAGGNLIPNPLALGRIGPLRHASEWLVGAPARSAQQLVPEAWKPEFARTEVENQLSQEEAELIAGMPLPDYADLGKTKRGRQLLAWLSPHKWNAREWNRTFGQAFYGDGSEAVPFFPEDLDPEKMTAGEEFYLWTSLPNNEDDQQEYERLRDKAINQRDERGQSTLTKKERALLKVYTRKSLITDPGGAQGIMGGNVFGPRSLEDFFDAGLFAGGGAGFKAWRAARRANWKRPGFKEELKRDWQATKDRLADPIQTPRQLAEAGKKGLDLTKQVGAAAADATKRAGQKIRQGASELPAAAIEAAKRAGQNIAQSEIPQAFARTARQTPEALGDLASQAGQSLRRTTANLGQDVEDAIQTNFPNAHARVREAFPPGTNRRLVEEVANAVKGAFQGGVILPISDAIRERFPTVDNIVEQVKYALATQRAGRSAPPLIRSGTDEPPTTPSPTAAPVAPPTLWRRFQSWLRDRRQRQETTTPPPPTASEWMPSPEEMRQRAAKYQQPGDGRRETLEKHSQKYRTERGAREKAQAERKKREAAERPPLVVTRHPALVEYLKEQGLIGDDAEVLPHVTAEQVRGRDVIGVLPTALAAQAKSLTEIPMRIPPELRGKELDLPTVRKLAGKPKKFFVSDQPPPTIPAPLPTALERSPEPRPQTTQEIIDWIQLTRDRTAERLKKEIGKRKQAESESREMVADKEFEKMLKVPPTNLVPGDSSDYTTIQGHLRDLKDRLASTMSYFETMRQKFPASKGGYIGDLDKKRMNAWRSRIRMIEKELKRRGEEPELSAEEITAKDLEANGWPKKKAQEIAKISQHRSIKRHDGGRVIWTDRVKGLRKYLNFIQSQQDADKYGVDKNKVLEGSEAANALHDLIRQAEKAAAEKAAPPQPPAKPPSIEDKFMDLTLRRKEILNEQFRRFFDMPKETIDDVKKLIGAMEEELRRADADYEKAATPGVKKNIDYQRTWLRKHIEDAFLYAKLQLGENLRPPRKPDALRRPAKTAKPTEADWPAAGATTGRPPRKKMPRREDYENLGEYLSDVADATPETWMRAKDIVAKPSKFQVRKNVDEQGVSEERRIRKEDPISEHDLGTLMVYRAAPTAENPNPEATVFEGHHRLDKVKRTDPNMLVRVKVFDGRNISEEESAMLGLISNARQVGNLRDIDAAFAIKQYPQIRSALSRMKQPQIREGLAQLSDDLLHIILRNENDQKHGRLSPAHASLIGRMINKDSVLWPQKREYSEAEKEAEVARIQEQAFNDFSAMPSGERSVENIQNLIRFKYLPSLAFSELPDLFGGATFDDKKMQLVADLFTAAERHLKSIKGTYLTDLGDIKVVEGAGDAKISQASQIAARNKKMEEYRKFIRLSSGAKSGLASPLLKEAQRLVVEYVNKDVAGKRKRQGEWSEVVRKFLQIIENYGEDDTPAAPTTRPTPAARTPRILAPKTFDEFQRQNPDGTREQYEAIKKRAAAQKKELGGKKQYGESRQRKDTEKKQIKDRLKENEARRMAEREFVADPLGKTPRTTTPEPELFGEQQAELPTAKPKKPAEEMPARSEVYQEILNEVEQSKMGETAELTETFQSKKTKRGYELFYRPGRGKKYEPAGIYNSAEEVTDQIEEFYRASQQGEERVLEAERKESSPPETTPKTPEEPKLEEKTAAGDIKSRLTEAGVNEQDAEQIQELIKQLSQSESEEARAEIARISQRYESGSSQQTAIQDEYRRMEQSIATPQPGRQPPSAEPKPSKKPSPESWELSDSNLLAKKLESEGLTESEAGNVARFVHTMRDPLASREAEMMTNTVIPEIKEVLQKYEAQDANSPATQHLKQLLAEAEELQEAWATWLTFNRRTQSYADRKYKDIAADIQEGGINPAWLQRIINDPVEGINRKLEAVKAELARDPKNKTLLRNKTKLVLLLHQARNTILANLEVADVKSAHAIRAQELALRPVKHRDHKTYQAVHKVLVDLANRYENGSKASVALNKLAEEYLQAHKQRSKFGRVELGLKGDEKGDEKGETETSAEGKEAVTLSDLQNAGRGAVIPKAPVPIAPFDAEFEFEELIKRQLDGKISDEEYYKSLDDLFARLSAKLAKTEKPEAADFNLKDEIEIEKARSPEELDNIQERLAAEERKLKSQESSFFKLTRLAGLGKVDKIIAATKRNLEKRKPPATSEKPDTPTDAEEAAFKQWKNKQAEEKQRLMGMMRHPLGAAYADMSLDSEKLSKRRQEILRKKHDRLWKMPTKTEADSENLIGEIKKELRRVDSELQQATTENAKKLLGYERTFLRFHLSRGDYWSSKSYFDEERTAGRIKPAKTKPAAKPEEPAITIKVAQDGRALLSKSMLSDLAAELGYIHGFRMGMLGPNDPLAKEAVQKINQAVTAGEESVEFKSEDGKKSFTVRILPLSQTAPPPPKPATQPDAADAEIRKPLEDAGVSKEDIEKAMELYHRPTNPGEDPPSYLPIYHQLRDDLVKDYFRASTQERAIQKFAKEYFDKKSAEEKELAEVSADQTITLKLHNGQLRITKADSKRIEIALSVQQGMLTGRRLGPQSPEVVHAIDKIKKAFEAGHSAVLLPGTAQGKAFRINLPKKPTSQETTAREMHKAGWSKKQAQEIADLFHIPVHSRKEALERKTNLRVFRGFNRLRKGVTRYRGERLVEYGSKADKALGEIIVKAAKEERDWARKERKLKSLPPPIPVKPKTPATESPHYQQASSERKAEIQQKYHELLGNIPENNLNSLRNLQNRIAGLQANLAGKSGTTADAREKARISQEQEFLTGYFEKARNKYDVMLANRKALDEIDEAEQNVHGKRREEQVKLLEEALAKFNALPPLTKANWDADDLIKAKDKKEWIQKQIKDQKAIISEERERESAVAKETASMLEKLKQRGIDEETAKKMAPLLPDKWEKVAVDMEYGSWKNFGISKFGEGTPNFPYLDELWDLFSKQPGGITTHPKAFEVYTEIMFGRRKPSAAESSKQGIPVRLPTIDARWVVDLRTSPKRRFSDPDQGNEREWLEFARAKSGRVLRKMDEEGKKSKAGIRIQGEWRHVPLLKTFVDVDPSQKGMFAFVESGKGNPWIGKRGGEVTLPPGTNIIWRTEHGEYAVGRVKEGVQEDTVDYGKTSNIEWYRTPEWEHVEGKMFNDIQQTVNNAMLYRQPKAELEKQIKVWEKEYETAKSKSYADEWEREMSLHNISELAFKMLKSGMPAKHLDDQTLARFAKFVADADNRYQAYRAKQDQAEADAAKERKKTEHVRKTNDYTFDGPEDTAEQLRAKIKLVQEESQKQLSLRQAEEKRIYTAFDKNWTPGSGVPKGFDVSAASRRGEFDEATKLQRKADELQSIRIDLDQKLMREHLGPEIEKQITYTKKGAGKGELMAWIPPQVFYDPYVRNAMRSGSWKQAGPEGAQIAVQAGNHIGIRPPETHEGHHIEIKTPTIKEFKEKNLQADDEIRRGEEAEKKLATLKAKEEEAELNFDGLDIDKESTFRAKIKRVFDGPEDTAEQLRAKIKLEEEALEKRQKPEKAAREEFFRSVDKNWKPGDKQPDFDYDAVKDTDAWINFQKERLLNQRLGEEITSLYRKLLHEHLVPPIEKQITYRKSSGVRSRLEVSIPPKVHYHPNWDMRGRGDLKWQYSGDEGAKFIITAGRNIAIRFPEVDEDWEVEIKTPTLKELAQQKTKTTDDEPPPANEPASEAEPPQSAMAQSLESIAREIALVTRLDELDEETRHQQAKAGKQWQQGEKTEFDSGVEDGYWEDLIEKLENIKDDKRATPEEKNLADGLIEKIEREHHYHIPESVGDVKYDVEEMIDDKNVSGTLRYYVESSVAGKYEELDTRDYNRLSENIRIAKEELSESKSKLNAADYELLEKFLEEQERNIEARRMDPVKARQREQYLENALAERRAKREKEAERKEAEKKEAEKKEAEAKALAKKKEILDFAQDRTRGEQTVKERKQKAQNVKKWKEELSLTDAEKQGLTDEYWRLIFRDKFRFHNKPEGTPEEMLAKITAIEKADKKSFGYEQSDALIREADRIRAKMRQAEEERKAAKSTPIAPAKPAPAPAAKEPATAAPKKPSPPKEQSPTKKATAPQTTTKELHKAGFTKVRAGGLSDIYHRPVHSAAEAQQKAEDLQGEYSSIPQTHRPARGTQGWTAFQRLLEDALKKAKELARKESQAKAEAPPLSSILSGVRYDFKRRKRGGYIAEDKIKELKNEVVNALRENRPSPEESKQASGLLDELARYAGQVPPSLAKLRKEIGEFVIDGTLTDELADKVVKALPGKHENIDGKTADQLRQRINEVREELVELEDAETYDELIKVLDEHGEQVIDKRQTTKPKPVAPAEPPKTPPIKEPPATTAPEPSPRAEKAPEFLEFDAARNNKQAEKTFIKWFSDRVARLHYDYGQDLNAQKAPASLFQAASQKLKQAMQEGKESVEFKSPDGKEAFTVRILHPVAKASGKELERRAQEIMLRPEKMKPQLERKMEKLRRLNEGITKNRVIKPGMDTTEERAKTNIADKIAEEWYRLKVIKDYNLLGSERTEKARQAKLELIRQALHSVEEIHPKYQKEAKKVNHMKLQMRRALNKEKQRIERNEPSLRELIEQDAAAKKQQAIASNPRGTVQRNTISYPAETVKPLLAGLGLEEEHEKTGNFPNLDDLTVGKQIVDPRRRYRFRAAISEPYADYTPEVGRQKVDQAMQSIRQLQTEAERQPKPSGAAVPDWIYEWKRAGKSADDAAQNQLSTLQRHAQKLPLPPDELKELIADTPRLLLTVQDVLEKWDQEGRKSSPDYSDADMNEWSAAFKEYQAVMDVYSDFPAEAKAYQGALEFLQKIKAAFYQPKKSSKPPPPDQEKPLSPEEKAEIAEEKKQEAALKPILRNMAVGESIVFERKGSRSLKVQRMDGENWKLFVRLPDSDYTRAIDEVLEGEGGQAGDWAASTDGDVDYLANDLADSHGVRVADLKRTSKETAPPAANQPTTKTEAPKEESEPVEDVVPASQLQKKGVSPERVNEAWRAIQKANSAAPTREKLEAFNNLVLGVENDLVKLGEQQLNNLANKKLEAAAEKLLEEKKFYNDEIKKIRGGRSFEEKYQNLLDQQKRLTGPRDPQAITLLNAIKKAITAAKEAQQEISVNTSFKDLTNDEIKWLEQLRKEIKRDHPGAQEVVNLAPLPIGGMERHHAAVTGIPPIPASPTLSPRRRGRPLPRPIPIRRAA